MEKTKSAWWRNPAYFENLRTKAERHGIEWVRANKRQIDAYWNNAGTLLAAKGAHQEARLARRLVTQGGSTGCTR